jgi:predicted histone-like DNA-binding protein
MKVKFKSIVRTQPGVAGGGTKKFYAHIVRNEKIDIRTFAEEISEMSTHTTGDVYGILEMFLQKVKNHVLAGRSVDLWNLGTFSPSLSSLPSDDPLSVNNRSITKYKVLFRPSMYLKDQLSHVKFEKIGNDTLEPEA